ncbi:sigma-70 family RNA polymerase sigma factor [Mumia sp. Pv 4-285]|uniref:sigma-70 family RNA polymerase sigma factor n=1 Tax=Mumia qirimensis TaxID=3234852 RepID=UPI00351CE8E2
MEDQTADSTVPSDAELISAVRAGDNAAYGVLFERHRDAAQRMARQLVRGPDADDLVSEAFIKVMDQLRAGAGPDVAFRAYLLTAIRRLHIDRVRAQQRTQPTDDLERYDSGVEFDDTAVAQFENSAAAKAFASLPERWQLVLWHLDVEGAKPADIAPILGMTANGVSALAYRAREGLRQAYLQVHLADTAAEECRWTTEHLGAYVRQGLGKRDNAAVREHLDGCARCTAVYLELVEVNSGLRGLLAPVLLGTVGLAYVADISGQAAVGAASGATGWVGSTAGRARDWVVSAPTHGLAAAGVTLGVVGAAVTGTLLFMTLGLPTTPSSEQASDTPSLSLPGPSQLSPDDTAPSAAAPPAPPTAVVPQALPQVLPPAPLPSQVPAPVPDDPPAGDPPADGPVPDDPRQDEPPADDPGTDDPGTDDPTPTDPGPTEPTPTEPTEPPVVPSAPSDLAISDEPDGVTLRWSAVTGADGYQVYRTTSTTTAAIGRSAALAVSGELVSGPTPLTTTSFVDRDAPNGGRVLYEVVARNAHGDSEAATLGPIRLPSTGILSVRPIGFGTQCVLADGRGSSPVRLTRDCGSATVWRVWDDGNGSGWTTMRAASGNGAGRCMTSASNPLISIVSLSACGSTVQQQWGLDPSLTTTQQIASRARQSQVLDATTASLGGPLVATLRINHGELDRNQRFTFVLTEPVSEARSR